VPREKISDPVLLNLKYKLLELFENKFIITSDGAIREKIE
jgi:hypothetical protein